MERICVLNVLQMLVVLMAVCKGANGACDATNSVLFQEINPAMYSERYVDIVDAGVNDRPLGFNSTVVRYMNPPEPVCVKVTGAEGRGIEVMFETDPPAYLCFRDQTGEVECAQGRFYDCGYAKADTMIYDFYYNIAEGSSQSDVNFWLRITKGDANDADLGWCHNRDNKFPSSLLQAGQYFDPRPAPTERPNSGSTLDYRILLIVSSVILSIAH